MNTLKQYNTVIEQCRTLFINKMKDYGCAWRILRLPSLTDQILIKAQRIRGLQENTEHKIDEDETAEFIGIINYALMALIQIDKGVATQPDLNLEEATALYDAKVSLQKLLRVKQIEDNKGKTLVSEGIDANYQDMINYAVFALIHLNNQHNN